MRCPEFILHVRFLLAPDFHSAPFLHGTSSKFHPFSVQLWCAMLLAIASYIIQHRRDNFTAAVDSDSFVYPCSVRHSHGAAVQPFCHFSTRMVMPLLSIASSNCASRRGTLLSFLKFLKSHWFLHPSKPSALCVFWQHLCSIKNPPSIQLLRIKMLLLWQST